jgi:transcriptional regulator with XRE-family HTH domain
LPRRRKQGPPAPIDDKEIGQRLKRIRLQRGLTQVEIAEKLGITQGVVSEYERGAVRLHGALLAAFAKALKASPNEILGFEKLQDDSILKDRSFLRRLQRIDTLSKGEKQAVLKTLDLLLRNARSA